MPCAERKFKDRNVKAAYDYSPYGVLIGSAGDPSFKQPYQYSTKHIDAETGISTDRDCFGLEAFKGGENEILFRVVGLSESPWPDTDLLGQRQKFVSSIVKRGF